jgi:pilus assembly protein CpaE
MIVVLRRDPEFLVLTGRVVGRPELVILEVDEGDPDQVLSDIRLVTEASPTAEVFVTASRNDPTLILSVFRAGAKEFFPQPLDEYAFAQALMRFRERFVRQRGGADLKEGTLVAIVGAKAGVGVTSVAMNVARALVKEAPGKRVAVVDLDISGSDMPVFTSLEKAAGIKELVKDVSRLDETMVANGLSNPEPGVFVLPSGYPYWTQEVPERGSIVHLLSLIVPQFDVILLDCGNDLRSHVQEALELASRVWLVTTIDVASIRRTKAMLEKGLVKKADRAPVELIINRYLADDEEVIAKTETILQRRVSWRIPYDDENFRQSMLTASSPLANAPRSPLTASYIKQARQLLAGRAGGRSENQAASADKTSLLGRWFSRKS